MFGRQLGGARRLLKLRSSCPGVQTPSEVAGGGCDARGASRRTTLSLHLDGPRASHEARGPQSRSPGRCREGDSRPLSRQEAVSQPATQAPLTTGGRWRVPRTLQSSNLGLICIMAEGSPIARDILTPHP